MTELTASKGLLRPMPFGTLRPDEQIFFIVHKLQLYHSMALKNCTTQVPANRSIEEIQTALVV
jgi:hypothetical protein